MAKRDGILTGDRGAWRSCLRKHVYSKATAIAVARKARKRTGHDIRHYRCGHCGCWHVGHAR